MLAGVALVRRERVPLCLLLAGVGQIAALSFTSQPEPRYVFFGTVLLVVLGVDGLRRIVVRLPTSTHIYLLIASALAVCALWTTSIVNAPRYATVRASGPTKTLLAAAIIAQDRGSAACEVVGTDITRLEWYSGCRAVHVPDLSWSFRRYWVNDGVVSTVPIGAERIAFLPGIVDIVRAR
jgi:hypothetical protein